MKKKYIKKNKKKLKNIKKEKEKKNNQSVQKLIYISAVPLKDHF
jgi:hypothetical protein